MYTRHRGRACKPTIKARACLANLCTSSPPAAIASESEPSYTEARVRASYLEMLWSFELRLLVAVPLHLTPFVRQLHLRLS